MTGVAEQEKTNVVARDERPTTVPAPATETAPPRNGENT